MAPSRASEAVCGDVSNNDRLSCTRMSLQQSLDKGVNTIPITHKHQATSMEEERGVDSKMAECITKLRSVRARLEQPVRNTPPKEEVELHESLTSHDLLNPSADTPPVSIAPVGLEVAEEIIEPINVQINTATTPAFDIIATATTKTEKSESGITCNAVQTGLRSPGLSRLSSVPPPLTPAPNCNMRLQHAPPGAPATATTSNISSLLQSSQAQAEKRPTLPTAAAQITASKTGRDQAAEAAKKQSLRSSDATSTTAKKIPFAPSAAECSVAPPKQLPPSTASPPAAIAASSKTPAVPNKDPAAPTPPSPLKYSNIPTPRHAVIPPPRPPSPKIDDLESIPPRPPLPKLYMLKRRAMSLGDGLVPEKPPQPPERAKSADNSDGKWRFRHNMHSSRHH